MALDLQKFYQTRTRFLWTGTGVFFCGTAALVVDWTTSMPTTVKGEFTGLWLLVMALGAVFYYYGVRLPLREALELALEHGGRMTLTELAKGLQINVWTAEQTLKKLSAKGLVYVDPADQERQVWVFRDCVPLPLDQALQLARQHDGCITATDLVNQGVPIDIAQRTLLALSVKDVLQQDDQKREVYRLTAPPVTTKAALNDSFLKAASQPPMPGATSGATPGMRPRNLESDGQ